MNVELVMDNWVINDEYFITEGVNGYEVYCCGTEESEAEQIYSNESFESCLIWIWDSL